MFLISWFCMVLLWGGFRWAQQCQGPGVSKHSKTIQKHFKTVSNMVQFCVGGIFFLPETSMEADINHQIAQHGPKLDPKSPNMGPS